MKTLPQSLRAEPLKSQLALAVTLVIVGCASTDERRHTNLMNNIEKEIQLPPGAAKISQYARAYKFDSHDRITAFYFIPQNVDGFCQGAKRGGRTNGQIALACPPPDGMKAGERRWFDNDVYLPEVNDGGCNYIDVEYDLKTNAVTYAQCHGLE